MGKWIKFSKHSWGLAGSILIFNKINFYAGVTDHWGVGANVNFYDRSLTFEILCWYLGVEIFHSEKYTITEPRSKGDLFD
jgi:hypothetical protein